MALAECPRCKKLFQKAQAPICPRCVSDEEADYEKVRDSLSELPNQTAEQVAEHTGVPIECVMRLLGEGRIQNVKATQSIRCGRCGAPAISISKRLCESCLQKLNAEIASQQSRIKLPPKKRKMMSLGNALDIRQKVEEKRNKGPEQQ